MKTITLKTKQGDRTKVNVLDTAEFIDRSGSIPDLSNLFVIRQKHGSKPRVEFFNDPVTFDIETSTTVIDDDQFTWMYHFQVCFCGVVITGRTWEEFSNLLKWLKYTLNLSESRRIIIYVHNFPYEFSFLNGRYNFKKIFARKPNKPITAEMGGEFVGFEFRCTYSISGKSLESLSRDISAIPYLKDKSDIDHTIIRTRKTPLTDQEIGYCAKDVLIPYYYIKYLQSKEINGFIHSIPITNTGFVRRDARNYFGYDPEFQKYFHRLELDGLQFILYNQAFRGGDTHANAWCCGEVFDGVGGYDITSSYPEKMLVCEFPSSPPHTIINPSIEEFNELFRGDYLFIVQLNLEDIRVRDFRATYIPTDKCNHLEKYKADNGRIVTAESLQITVTSIDFKIMLHNYYFSIAKINYIVFHHEKSLLPEKMREFILKLYREKTNLKGIQEREEEYRHSKEHINSLYGMTVTIPLNDEVEFDPGNHDTPWSVKKMMLTENNVDRITSELKKYYAKPDSFLPYEIGVFVTAYARADLHTAISQIQTDALYWDTDSIKFIGDHHKVFSDLNDRKLARLLSIGYSMSDVSPCDIKGNRHTIGYWDNEYPVPIRFKTFGAKKYFIETGEKNIITVAGLRKGAADYIKSRYGSVLNIELGDIIPSNYSGRTASEYIYYPFTLIVNGVECSEMSYVNIKPVEYTFGDTIEHKMYTLNCKKLYQERSR